ncbi:Oidioi.mRNA.OKI2018_I69.PAR.g11801.t1.cds [Oikopleura dioica]|uniref:Oidioi.mRNA.OKI2018_I69.PAR.g11801.t1.cds n=1 Tax=Oikopleura dioica TaxID=34765 RepID=A0ABN7S0R4_OIKDI|nr:Oidioi.mRNA.OKI2018_I69.PAR.g11801.t1.cds [Oikopleura dioica]
MDKNGTDTDGPQNVLQTSMAGLAIFVIVLTFMISCRRCLMKPCGATKAEKDAEHSRQAKRSASRKLEESKDLRSSLESIQSLA